MPYVLITPPEEEPLAAFDAETHLRLESGDDSDYVSRLIVAARQHVEAFTGRALVTQTWELVLDGFPDDDEPIVLEKGRLQSATAPTVKYRDANGTEQTLASSAYQVDTESEPGRILLVSGGTWPTTYERYDAVRVRFVAGYGDAEDVPSAVKQAMLLLVGDMYAHRETESEGRTVTPYSFAVEALLGPYRLSWVL